MYARITDSPRTAQFTCPVRADVAGDSEPEVVSNETDVDSLDCADDYLPVRSDVDGQDRDALSGNRNAVETDRTEVDSGNWTDEDEQATHVDYDLSAYTRSACTSIRDRGRSRANQKAERENRNVAEIPIDATIDSIRAGGTKAKPGIAFRWRWPKRGEDGRELRDARNRIVRGSRYLRWLSYDDHRNLKRYWKSKKRFYEQAQEWQAQIRERRAERSGNSAGDHSSDDVDLSRG